MILQPPRPTLFPYTTLFRSKPQAKDTPFVVEYYYKAKWGHANEFIALFKKNHYPLLKKEIELGRIMILLEERDEFVGVSDRKSTRLNSSHLGISYAVFCLKK